MTEKRTRRNFFIEDSLYAELEAYARRKNLKPAQALRSLLRAALDAEKEAKAAPRWVKDLQVLAERLGTDTEGAVAVLREYIETPEQEQQEPAKPKGVKLRSFFSL